MKADSPHWKVMGPPASPEEAAALDAFREVLPDDGRHTAWVNLTFIDENARTAEVDVLLLTPVGFFCVELKGWHGTITGNSQRWYQPGKSHPNPFLVTDRKGKRLASLLKSYATTPQQKSMVPWVNALVVMHGNGSQFDVGPDGRAGVIKLDGYEVKAKRPLRRLSEFLQTPPSNPKDSIDPQRAQLVRLLCEKANFRPTPKTRMVGDYAVAEADPIADGPTWQDVVVKHPSVPKVRQRVRLYDVPPKSSVSERTRIEQLARREFQLTYGIKHEGIAAAQQYLTTDDGPALVFDYDDAETPLGEFLNDDGAGLTLAERVALVEQLGDTLRYAHDRHLYHRALSPQRVWVRPTAQGLRLEVRDWYSAQQERESTTSWTAIGRGVTDLMSIAGTDDLLWLAPEARHTVADVPGAPLDVFGFGALAFLILTGKPPATSIAQVQQVQVDDGRFDPRTVTAALPDGLSDVVGLMTAVDEAERPASVEDALDLFRAEWGKVRRPDDDAPREEVTDPLDAQSDDVIGGRFIVDGRRGEGSSGVALAVQDVDAADEKVLVLKVARDDAAGRRLDIEAEVLAGLDHPRIVRLHESLELGGRRALLMSDAGKETMATRLAKEGQVTLEYLGRWGTDLLEATAYLVDVQGVFHRDIKPANLGIALDPGYRKPRLTLFDFSLAREPLEHVASGTRGYLDPYLGVGRRSQYDRAAELWAVSVTLFEMATGVLPWWPGGAGPTSPKDPTPPVIEPTSFDPAVAAPLTSLFRKALAPDAKDRFSSVEDLLQAWVAAFASLAVDDEDRRKDDALAQAAGLETLLEQSGLSAQALSALRRLDGVVTVADLLGVAPSRISVLRGLGETYRKEIMARIGQWRAALRPAEPVLGPEVALGVDRVVRHLIDGLPSQDQPLAERVLGLGGGSAWPAVAEVAAEFQTTRERITTLLDDAVSDWSGYAPFTTARTEAARLLHDAGRVATVPDLAASLVTLRGSTLDGDARAAYGVALLRAIVELDAREAEPLFVLRRRAGTKADLIALGEDATVPGIDGGGQHPPADLLTELARELGDRADALVEGGVVAQAQAVAALRDEVAQGDPASLWQVDDGPLLRLAAAASQTAAVSRFLELYPTALPTKVALEHAMRGKPGRSISQMAVRRTVGARFPHLTNPLPTQTASLDALMHDLYPDLVRDKDVYVPKSTALLPTGTVTATRFAPTPAAEVSRRLAESLHRHAALTLAVSPRRYVAATRALRAAFDVDVLDIGELVVTATRDTLERAGGRWDGLLGYDAYPHDSRQWQGLVGVVQKAVEPALTERLATPTALLITNAGPLVRYGMTPILAALLDTGTPRPAARWLLVAKTGDAHAPHLEGRPVPLGPSGWIDLPRDLTTSTASVVEPVETTTQKEAR